MTIQAGIRVPCPTAALTTPDHRGSPERALLSPGLTLVQSLDGEQSEYRSRDLTGRVLAFLGIDPDTTYQAQLAVQELATNARRHAPPPHELRIAIRASDVKIAVTDADPGHEAVAQSLATANSSQPGQDTSLLSESGRGLLIIARLFPGACGAGPAGAASRARQAKQVWISIPFPAS
ncbi:MAG TPA: ATP-binding protein [Trebonia sp.]|jgi:anti-sigma regulatory factor (Ser/Thr protein kinase)|nr:ATP-binding protein [Trebonia sp.]